MKSIEEVRKEYLEILKEQEKLNRRQNLISHELREILDNETDQSKKEEIINYVFNDNVEEVHEYAFRKLYLKSAK